MVFINCKHFDDVRTCCMNIESNNYGGECFYGECQDFEHYFDNTEEVLYRYLRLEERTYNQIIHNNEFDSETKKHLKAIYNGKIELLKELLKELYE